jgi:hypothetical protein
MLLPVFVVKIVRYQTVADLPGGSGFVSCINGESVSISPLAMAAANH